MKRPLVSTAVVLLVAAALVYAAAPGRKQQNMDMQGSALDEASFSELQTKVALPDLKQEGPEVDSSKEIVNNVLLSNVPKADYSYSFNGQLSDAVVVTRTGDVDHFNEGTYPEPSADVFPLFTEGVEGDALYLDGTYGVSLQGVEPLNASYTISFWFRADELFDWSPFLMVGSHLMDVGGSQSFLSINKKTTEEGEQVVPVFNTIDAAADNSCEVRPTLEQKKCIDLNKWVYITICVDASQSGRLEGERAMGYLYLNSELIGSDEVSLLHMDPEGICAYLGINCYDQLFRASYDEVHIWRHVLDENQISSMYAAYISE